MLSVAHIQKRMLAEEQAKVKYQQMRKNERQRELGKPGETGTRIMDVKQVETPNLVNWEDNPGKPVLPQADDQVAAVDRLPHGIFTATAANERGPAKPSTEKVKAPRNTRMREVNNTIRRTDESSFWSKSPSAQEIIDPMPHSVFNRPDTDVPTVKAPSPKNLHGTTAPKSSEKKANMDRDLDGHKVPKPVPDKIEFNSVPSEAGKPPKPEKIRSGVAVRVNESIKARFDIVSESVLRKVVDRYKQFGYNVRVEPVAESAWKSDKALISALRESLAAKYNGAEDFANNARSAALNRFFQLVKKDANAFYESRGAFLSTVKQAFEKIMERADASYRSTFRVFDGVARIRRDGKLHDVSLVTEGTNEQMAARLIRNAMFEEFGLGIDLVHVFVDGKKFLPEQIQEWASVTEAKRGHGVRKPKMGGTVGTGRSLRPKQTKRPAMGKR